MLRIGEFSKLSHLTVKALRFYEKEGILKPASVDAWTGYRLYETSQLEVAARVKACRQLGLTIEEIRSIQSGTDLRKVLTVKAESLQIQRDEIDNRLSIIHYLLEDNVMNVEISVKEIPAAIVYYSEVRVNAYSDMMRVIPELGRECMELNPGLKCVEPPYEFCEYPEGEYKETDILIRHNEAVEGMGREGGRIRFREIPAVKVLSLYYKGPYEGIGEAYTSLMKYAEENGYRPAGLSRECYIDGVWNKESPSDWLTEIQLPIE